MNCFRGDWVPWCSMQCVGIVVSGSCWWVWPAYYRDLHRVHPLLLSHSKMNWVHIPTRYDDSSRYSTRFIIFQDSRSSCILMYLARKRERVDMIQALGHLQVGNRKTKVQLQPVMTYSSCCCFFLSLFPIHGMMKIRLTTVVGAQPEAMC